MENIILKFIGQNIKGVDTYQHNGSNWLIFTDEKKWVIELTKDGTLWYNYNFFNSIFSFFSLNVIENQHYITKWVEDAIQNGVRNTSLSIFKNKCSVEDAIQNGVRNTLSSNGLSLIVEDAIQNGVKNTSYDLVCLYLQVEDTIQNGVRNTSCAFCDESECVEDTIQNGVKNTLPEKTTCSPHLLEDIVQNGVKRTCNTSIDMESIQHTIQNGIKNTEPGGYLGPITIRGKVFHQFESSNQTDNVGNVIQNGVKETKAMDEAVFQGVKY